MVVAERQKAAGLEDPVQFAQDIARPGEMVKGVVEEHRVHTRVGMASPAASRPAVPPRGKCQRNERPRRGARNGGANSRIRRRVLQAFHLDHMGIGYGLDPERGGRVEGARDPRRGMGGGRRKQTWSSEGRRKIRF